MRDKQKRTLWTLGALGLGLLALRSVYVRTSMPPYSGVVFPVEPMRVTLRFAAVTAPWYSEKNPHKGLDIAPYAGSYGAPVVAASSGKVVKAVRSNQGLGNYVALEHSLPFTWWAADIGGGVRTVAANEPFYLLYAHLQTLNVKKGQNVATGQKIGEVGSTGYSSGPHVHLELRLGDYAVRDVVDPEHLFAAAMVGYKSEVRYAA